MKIFLTLGFWALILGVCEARAEGWKTSLGAETELENSVWASQTVGPDTQKYRPNLFTKVPFSLRKNRSFRLKLTPSLYLDPKSPSAREHFFADLPEGNIQLQFLPWTIQAGLNTFSWGDTDVFNPLDVINPRRYFDPFRAEKLGVPALMVKRDFEKFFAEFIYIPVQRKAELPGEKSRWMPRDVYRVRSFPTAVGPTRVILPSNLAFRYTETTEVDSALKNNLALRLKFRFTGFDWTLAAYQGAAPTPDVRLRQITVTGQSVSGGLTTVTVDPDIGLQAGFYPIRMTGTSFAWVLGDFLVKGAAAYTHVLNRRYDLPARIWENVLGLERTLSVGSGTLTALVQGTYVNRGDSLDTGTVSLARMFDEAAMGALRWAPTERWTVLGSYLRDIKYQGNLIHGEISYKVADGWRLKTAADFLGGDPETPIGTYGRNDRVSLSLLTQF